MSHRSRWVLLAVLALGLVGLLVLGSADGEPLDPDSTRPDGARGLVRLLEDFAGEVRVLDEVPGIEVDADVAVLLRDELSRAAAVALSAWVADGGTLIVADPTSPFAPEPLLNQALLRAPPDQLGACEIAALADVSQIVADAVSSFPTSDRGQGCFTRGDGWLITAEPVGDGVVVVVGAPAIFTNELIDAADNAVVAVTLAAPDADVSVAVLRSRLAAPPLEETPDAPATPRERDEVGGGDDDLLDLLPGYLRWVVVTLAVAWLVHAVGRARRLGPPVAERQPVRIAGSELVRATGRLLRRADPADTSQMLVDAARHDLADGLGLPRDVALVELARTAASRCDLDAVDIAAALSPPGPLDDVGLVRLVRRLDHIHQEVLRDRASALF